MKLLALAFALLGIHVGGHRVFAGQAPAWSPDGERLAYVARGDLWVADADGSHRVLLVSRADQPAWSPDGRRLAFTREDAVWVVRADGLGERRLVRGAHPAWSPDGLRVAYDDEGEVRVKRADGLGASRVIGAGHDPAYTPDGHLAWADGQIVVAGTPITTDATDAYAPSVSTGGGRVAYVDGGRLFSVGIHGGAPRPLGRGYQPAWRPRPRVRELLPDFDQRAPSRLTLARNGRGHWQLGFRSAVANVGSGAFHLAASRRAGEPVMHATQRVALAGGGTRAYAGAGLLRYVSADNHVHWHFLPFEVYELRSSDGRLLMRDHKSGFCIADHHRTSGKVPPRFLGNCATGEPGATRLEEGSSVGYTDIYPPNFHGQNLDVTRVPAGTYVLVHRVNPRLQVRELRYTNNAAAVRIRLGWHADTPSVTVVRTCEETAAC